MSLRKQRQGISKEFTLKGLHIRALKKVTINGVIFMRFHMLSGHILDVPPRIKWAKQYWTCGIPIC